MKIPLISHSEKLRLVKTSVWNTHLKNHDNEGKFYIHLFESNKGSRSIEIETTYTGIGNPMYIIKQYELYHNTVYPWLKGKYDPTIPSYDRSAEIDQITEKNKIIPFKLVENK